MKARAHWIVPLGIVAACAGSAPAPPAPPSLASGAPGAPGATSAHGPSAPERRATPVLPQEPGSWSLDDLLARIAAANPTLGAAQARFDQAQAARAEVVASYYPELSFGVDYVSTDNPGQAFGLLLNQESLSLGPAFDPTPGATENWRKEVRLDWALFAPGRAEGRRAASAAEEAARLAREAIERRLLNGGVQAWLGLRTARALEEVVQESIAVVERRLAQTRERHEAGAALRADVLRLEVRLAHARQEAARSRLAVVRAEAGLNHLLDRPADALLALAEEEAPVGAALGRSLDELLVTAAIERRDLSAAAERVRMLGAQREAAGAARLPRLGLFAAYDIDGDDPGLDVDLDSYTLGVGLRVPLSARTGPRIRRAEAAEHEAQEELRSLEASVAEEVRGALEAWRVAEETLELASASVGAAEEAWRIVAAAQDAGGATVTDVLEAEDAQRTSRVRHVAARMGVELARARLVAAIGGVR